MPEPRKVPDHVARLLASSKESVVAENARLHDERRGDVEDSSDRVVDELLTAHTVSLLLLRDVTDLASVVALAEKNRR